MKKSLAIYPGTFDPITLGHLDLINRSIDIFDSVLVVLSVNSHKSPLLSVKQRIQMIENDISKLIKKSKRSRVQVDYSTQLLAEYAKQKQAKIIIRGLRAVSDFEYEFQWHGMMNSLNHDVEVVFLMGVEKYQFISSSFIKEVAMLGGDVSQFVSENTFKVLQKKLISSKKPIKISK